MDRPVLAIILQYQHTGTLGIIRVLFNNDRSWNTCQYITNEDIVVSYFIVPMSGNPGLVLFDELENFLEDFAHEGNYT